MELMTVKKWRSMSDQECIEHLQDHEVEYRSTETGGRTYYQALVGGVIMSQWQTSKQLCAEEAVKNLAVYIGQLKSRQEVAA